MRFLSFLSLALLTALASPFVIGQTKPAVFATVGVEEAARSAWLFARFGYRNLKDPTHPLARNELRVEQTVSGNTVEKTIRFTTEQAIAAAAFAVIVASWFSAFLVGGVLGLVPWKLLLGLALVGGIAFSPFIATFRPFVSLPPEAAQIGGIHVSLLGIALLAGIGAAQVLRAT